MKPFKVLAIALVALFSYTAVSAQAPHHPRKHHHRRHHHKHPRPIHH